MRENWLNAFRFLFASMVLFSHCYPLTHGSDRAEPLHRWSSGQLTLGDLAVNAFFLISGFLIVRSWLQVRSMAVYFQHRILRIHPAFVTALLISLILATLSSAIPSEYLTGLRWRQVLVGALTLAYGTLDNPGTVFARNPFAGAVNASLWTVPLEFLAYIGVAIYGLFGLFKFRRLWLVFASFVTAVYLAKIIRDGQADAWWRFGCFFVVGATFYLTRDVLPRRRWLLMIALVMLGAGLVYAPLLNAVLPVAGGWVLFHIAFLPVPLAIDGLFRTDISYGMYLYAFPIQQTIVHFFGVRDPLVLFCAALPPTLLLAWLSWTFVERRFLALKSCSFADRDPAV